MDIPCSGRPGWLAEKKHTDFPSLPSFGKALLQYGVMWWSFPLASPVAVVTSVLDLAHCRGMQQFPRCKICSLPWAQKSPNYETLVKRSLSKSGIFRNKSSTALLHFSKCNNAPFPLQPIMRNKGIKRDRNVPAFAHSWGTCISGPEGKLLWCASWQPGLKKSEGARGLFPQAPKALIPADPWTRLLCQS